jgi:hypothetical protein
MTESASYCNLDVMVYKFVIFRCKFLYKQKVKVQYISNVPQGDKPLFVNYMEKRFLTFSSSSLHISNVLPLPKLSVHRGDVYSFFFSNVSL